MRKKVLFGAGLCAQNAIRIIGKDNIEFIVDNDEKKSDTFLEGVPIYLFSKVSEKLKLYEIVIAVSEKYINEIRCQLDECGIDDYITIGYIQAEITREKIKNRVDYIAIYKRAINWILTNSINDEAIICNTDKKKGYPEVTGYYIPSLIRWGYRDLGIKYARWLMSIQKKDGSWMDTDGNDSYIFDTAQILKGLIAARQISNDTTEIDQSIKRACNWIINNMQESGRLVTPSERCWGNDINTCSELIHLYCLSPLKEAGEMYNIKEYIEAADKILNFYKQNYYEKIMNFSLLSHFYAYVMEALVDLGEIDMAKEAMNRMVAYQKSSGAVPAYNNVDWVCSTGLFQLAMVWFRLGDVEHGKRAFEYASRLQNLSGGWYGSYVSEENHQEINTYFPTSEISWANKYFLDALYYKNRAEFNSCADIFLDYIPFDDERYCCVKDVVAQTKAGDQVLDVGCGKGRYLNNLLIDIPNRVYYGVDVSNNVMDYIDHEKIKCKEGQLTCIPYEDNKFSVVYTCEALEHAIDFDSAIKEMARVTKSGGIIVVVDKNDGCYGELEIDEWEQWPNEEALKAIMLRYCCDVHIRHGLKYENMGNKNLFSAWIGCVK